MNSTILSARNRLLSLYSMRCGKGHRVDTSHLPERRLLIGTHHKSGTVWMHDVFARICRDFNLSWFVMDQSEKLPNDWQVLQHMHSQFPLDLMADQEVRGLHLIRDPRDMLVSGAFYHGTSSEAWLHAPNDGFGRKTYQETINALPDMSQKIEFEMEMATGWELAHMETWDYADERFMNLPYEQLIDDMNLRVFRELFEFLGFRGGALLVCLQHAYDNSLFSGNVASKGHVRSGRVEQWRKYFTRQLAERFSGKFPGLLEKLGYETDQNWINNCPE